MPNALSGAVWQTQPQPPGESRCSTLTVFVGGDVLIIFIIIIIILSV